MAQVAAADPSRLCRITPTIPDQGGLGEIFEAFQEDYTDHLSQQQLVPWKGELQRSMDGESRPDLISQRITQGVAKLAYEIAIDALTGQTLRDPSWTAIGPTSAPRMQIATPYSRAGLT